MVVHPAAVPVAGPAGARDIATDTHCPYCALQCGMSLAPAQDRGPDAGASPPVVVAPREFPTNKGGLCQKGWTSASLLTAHDRLTVPLVRDRTVDAAGAVTRGGLRPATWDEALGRVARGITEIQAASGRDAVAVFGGGGLTNEKAYALGKLARTVLRTANIDYNGRFCMASAAAGANRAFGADRGLPFPLAMQKRPL